MNILQRLLETDDADAKLDAWKAAVKKAHPDHASKLQFKGRIEKDQNGKQKNLISAEVPGIDRCFGVFDPDKLTGDVLED